jgi:hypothetical protein
MPFNGSGTYSVVYNFVTEAASAPIEIAKLDGQFSDMATALSNCILRDGTGLPTSTIDWNTQRITNLGASTTSTGPTTIAQFQSNAAKTLGSVAGTNTITGSLTPALTAYTAGMVVIFTPANNNTGATTLNINGLGALDILKNDGDALVSGDLIAGIPAFLILDSGADDWILQNPQTGLGDFARLSQENTFTAVVNSGASAVTISSAVPGMVWRDTGGAANNQYWRFLVSSEQLLYQISNDAFSSHGTWLTVDRTGTTVDTINLQATNVQANGSAVWHAGNITLASGTYTPTITALGNVSSSIAYVCQYMRVGSVVTVSGLVDITQTANGATQWEMSLPIASNFSGVNNCAGTAAHSESVVASIEASVIPDRALFVGSYSNAGVGKTFRFSFTYRVI